MKFTLSLIFIFISSVIFSSCDKQQQKAIINAYVNTESATVNGAAFKSTDTNADKNATGTSSQLTIDGTSASGQRITIAINNFTGATGTFSMSGAGSAAIGAFNTGASGAADIVATSGQVVIVSADTTTYANGVVYTGTFSFTVNGYAVTNGTFSVFVLS